MRHEDQSLRTDVTGTGQKGILGTQAMSEATVSRKLGRVLIVEDERIVAASLRKRLQSLGYEVPALAHSGEQAIVLAEQLQPNLVLMDIHLEGEMDGVQAAQQIHSLSIPVVYLTAFSNQDILERAKITEPYGYILKPYDERILSVVIEMALNKHRLERKLEEERRWLAATLTSIGDGVVATDEQGRITFMNPTAEQLTGWKKDEAAGRAVEDVLQLIHEDTRQPVVIPIRGAIAAQASVPLARGIVLIARDQTEKRVGDCAAPITDAEGSVLGGVMVFRTVTA